MTNCTQELAPTYSEFLKTGLTDQEIRLQAVKIAQSNNLACCGIEAILTDAKKIYDFIKDQQCQS